MANKNLKSLKFPELDDTYLVNPDGTEGQVFSFDANGLPAALSVDENPTNGSANLVKSGGIYNALSLKAPLASPALTGTPTAPTPTAGDDSTKVATTAFVRGEIATESAALEQMILANAENLASAFDSTATYAVGDLVLYDGAVYRFTTAHTGAWDAADVEQTTLGEEVTELGAAKADKTDVATADAALEQMILAAFPTATITNQSVASFADGADGIPVKKLIVNIEPIQAGFGNPSPYNVRPITERTLAYVRDTRKNLFDADGLLNASGWVKNADGSYTGYSNAIKYDVFNVNVNCIFKVFNVRKVGINFTFSANLSADSALYIGFSIINIDTGASRNKQLNSLTATSAILTSDCAANEYVSALWFSYGSNKSITLSELQLEIGAVATAYKPFAGTTHTINFPAAAGTVYGGTLRDNGDGTWTLTVTHGYIASYAGESINEPWISSEDVYLAGTTPTTGAQVVYPLTTPVTYTLTAESVKTLLGSNSIFADCGDVAALTYRADVGLYIEKKLAEA